MNPCLVYIGGAQNQNAFQLYPHSLVGNKKSHVPTEETQNWALQTSRDLVLNHSSLIGKQSHIMMGRVTQKPSHKLIHCIHKLRMRGLCRCTTATLLHISLLQCKTTISYSWKRNPRLWLVKGCQQPVCQIMGHREQFIIVVCRHHVSKRLMGISDYHMSR